MQCRDGREKELKLRKWQGRELAMGREENVSNFSDTPYAQPPQWEIKLFQMDYHL